MSKKLFAAICFILVVGISGESRAGFSLSLTLGGNYSLLVNDPGHSPRSGLNLEGVVGWRFALVSVELGLHHDFLRNMFQWRPGARLHLGWFFLRLAVPLALDLNFDLAKTADKAFNLGVLFGVGAEVKFGKFALIIEANISPFFIHINEQGVLLPAELRLGLGYHF
jgi:hypothetical protein